MKSICTAYQYRIYYKKGDDSMLTDRMKDELIQGFVIFLRITLKQLSYMDLLQGMKARRKVILI